MTTAIAFQIAVAVTTIIVLIVKLIEWKIKRDTLKEIAEPAIESKEWAEVFGDSMRKHFLSSYDAIIGDTNWRDFQPVLQIPETIKEKYRETINGKGSFVHNEEIKTEYISPAKLSGHKYPVSCKSCGQNLADYTEIDYLIYQCNFCDTVSDGRNQELPVPEKPILKVELSPNDILTEGKRIRPNENIKCPKFDVSKY